MNDDDDDDIVLDQQSRSASGSASGASTSNAVSQKKARKPMKRVVLAVAMIMLVRTAITTRLTAAPKSNQVHAEGCVEAGVEVGCLMVKDVKSGSLYNIMIKGSRPQVGDGIDFIGVPFNGVSICMQGIALEVIQWAPKESLQCARGEAPRK
jgi:hypothetical protein